MSLLAATLQISEEKTQDVTQKMSIIAQVLAYCSVISVYSFVSICINVYTDDIVVLHFFQTIQISYMMNVCVRCIHIQI